MLLRRQLEKDFAFAFVEFGLSEEEFLRQTPRQWMQRTEAWRNKQRREDIRTARVCMVLAWCHGNSDATEKDFIPGTEDEEQTPEEMLAAFKAAAPIPNG